MTAAPPHDDTDRPWRIQIEGGAAFEMARDEDTLLRGALRAGQGWAHECSVGGCGSCRFERVDGDVHDLWPQAPGLSARERQRGRLLACQSAVRSDLRVRVRLTADAVPARTPTRLRARLVHVRMLSVDMAEFTFATHTRADFLPGQYALLRLPDVTGVRAYSMSNLANDGGTWQFIVKRTPGGLGSAALFDRVVCGQHVELDGPYGHATLREDGERDLVCIAGGSGLAPMLSIVRGLLASKDARHAHLFVGLRSQADLGCLRVLDGIDALGALADSRLHVTTVLSSPLAEPAWSGPTGFVHEAAERMLPAPLGAYDFHFAGPPPMVDAVQNMLMLRHRVHPAQIRFDRYV